MHNPAGSARIVDVELSAPQREWVPADGPYGWAFCVVRLHGRPVGVVETALPVDPEELRRAIWADLGDTIRAHLAEDGLAAAGTLERIDACAPCRDERERLLEGSPSVAVVVPTRDRPERLTACLRSLQHLDYLPDVIVVVDNAPEVPSDGVVREVTGPVPVRYVREDRPGASWARNRGLMEAGTEIVAFVDDDVVVDREWLGTIVAGFRRAENVACVTGSILPLELETPAQVWMERQGGFRWRGFERQTFDAHSHRSSQRLYPYAAMRFGSAANMAVRADSLRAIGGFDPTIGPATPTHSAEELDVFLSFITHGYRIVYEPGAVLRHAHYREYAELRRQAYGYGVGFTAFLTKAVLARPSVALRLALYLPAIAWGYARNRGGDAAPRPDGDEIDAWTAGLRRAELRGYLVGPLAYLRARRQRRAVERRFGTPTTGAGLLEAPRAG